MNATIAPNILDRLVQRATRLYSLPAVAMEVVQLTSQADVDAGTLTRCIEKDPALTAKILRVVNSSLFAPRGQVANLNQALALLGTKPLKLLVLGFSLPDELLSELEEEILGKYWKFTLVKAVAARRISESVFDTPGDDAFLAGLLQDIGMLVLIQHLGQTYLRFFENVSANGGNLLDCEASTMGFDHVIVSARLLQHWGLPSSLVSTVATSFDKQQIVELDAPARTSVQSLHLAELVSQLLVYGRTAALDELLEAGQFYCDLQIDQLRSVVQELESTVPVLADCLSLRLPGEVAYSEVLLSAYAQLAEAATDVCRSLPPDDPSANNDRAQLAAEIQQLVGQPMIDEAGNAPELDPPQTASHIVNFHQRDPGLVGRVAAAVAACRQARLPLSLALVEVDDLPTLIFTQGTDGAQRSIHRLQTDIQQILGANVPILPLEEGRFAVVLSGVERQPAVEQARQLVHNVRRWAQDQPQTSLAISAGVATLSMPPRNFPAGELIEAAERCLSGVQLSGGDGVKSIDLC